ncbi:MAG: AEC family transporter [Prevotella sp.]|nr:AEC family transporter [Prevotella sp.]
MYAVMITLFAIVVVGYVAGKLGYMGGTFDKRLSKLVIDITCPALILSSAMSGELPDRGYILPLLAISVLTYAVLSVLAWGLSRLLGRRPEDRGVIAFALIFGNVGFMGYPVVASIFGHQAVFYAAVLNVVNTFAVFTIGTMMVTGGEGNSREKFNRKVLYGTPMLAAYAAMLIVALGIDNVPAVVSQPLTMIGNITVPAALLIIGSSMSNLPLKALLGNATVYATALLRLAVLPVGVHFLCLLLGFSPFVVGINTVVIAMPVATYGTILCLKYGRDTTLMAEITFITTLLSMVSIPLLVMLLR